MGVTEKDIEEARRSRRAAFEFVVHTIVGAVCLSLLVFVSYGMNRVIDWLHATEMSPFFVYGLTAVEYVLFLVDLYLFLLFLFRSVGRAHKCL